MLTILESLNYSFRNPKKHNLSNLPHQTVEKLQKKNHGVLRGPQLGKQHWRARLGTLRVKRSTAPWRRGLGTESMDCYPQQGIGFTLNCVTLNGVSTGTAFTLLSNGQYVPLNTTRANIWGRGSRVPRNFYFSTSRGVRRHSSVGIATPCGLDGPGIESRWRRDFPHPSRPALDPPNLLYNK